MRKKFEAQLADLNKSLIEMGGEIEFAIRNAVKALLEQDVALARQAIAYDDEIDAKEKDIESQCLKLLLQQQPVASDLRLISAALKMITDMERIGDQSADISGITVYLARKPYAYSLDRIQMIAGATIKMIKEAIDAFVIKDLELANSVIGQDDIVDNLYLQIKQDLISLIKEDVDNCEEAFDLMTIAKYFERIGDHAVNIAEWVVFSLTGEHKSNRII